MEEDTIAAYERSYTELPGLQRAARLEYRLLRTSGTLTLELREAPAGRAAACALPGLEEGFAALLLRFVYENGVPPEQLEDVVRDTLQEVGACVCKRYG